MASSTKRLVNLGPWRRAAWRRKSSQQKSLRGVVKEAGDRGHGSALEAAGKGGRFRKAWQTSFLDQKGTQNREEADALKRLSEWMATP